MSLNHLNFIGGGDFDIETSDPEIIENYLDFFTQIHPVLALPTERPTPAPMVPTLRPTAAPVVPTPAPVPVPTRAPIPAGRFPSPVAPTPAPVRKGRWPQKQTPAPSIRKPKTSETRTASYNAEWGASINNCQHGALPNVFFNCHEGGVIEIKGNVNAKCNVVGNDRIQCTQDSIEHDSTIDFSCSGIRNSHLMATATVGPNVVSDCQQNGNTVKFLTLSRECTDSIDVNQDCNGGLPYEQGDAFFCASPAICGDQYSCSELKLEPLAMSNTNTDLSCSSPTPDKDLNDHVFEQTLLSSISVIDWRLSGQKRGCSWHSPPLLIKCENGGHLHFEEDYPFCTMLPGNIGECQSFAPHSLESEVSMDLTVKCTGTSESQLVLSVEVLSQTVEAQCEPEGTIIQSVMLSRKCGKFGTDGFLINHHTFCDSQDQVFTVDHSHAHCFVGNTCLSEQGCSGMQIPLLTADTGSGPHGFCTYVE